MKGDTGGVVSFPATKSVSCRRLCVCVQLQNPQLSHAPLLLSHPLSPSKKVLGGARSRPLSCSLTLMLSGLAPSILRRSSLLVTPRLFSTSIKMSAIPTVPIPKDFVSLSLSLVLPPQAETCGLTGSTPPCRMPTCTSHWQSLTQKFKLSSTAR